MDWRRFFYHWLYELRQWSCLSRPLFWWLLAVLWAAVLVLLLWRPRRWLPATIGVLFFWALLLSLNMVARRQAYLSWEAENVPEPEPAPFFPEQRVDLRTTGLFSVGGKKKYFRALPGFFETFVTREHVIVGRVVDRRFLWLHRARSEDVGLWYSFLQPQNLQAVRPGVVYVARHAYPALEVVHRGENGVLKYYLFFEHAQARQLVWADLLADLA